MSTEYQASAYPFARKLASGRSFTGTSIYDGVFAGPGKHGVSTCVSSSSPVENYAEIFGGFRDARRSSIPVLDFPGRHDRKVAVDVRSSKLDYSKIFGGLGGLGDTASYEELVNKRTERSSFAGEARTQDSIRSSPKLSGNSLNESEVSSHEASYKSRDREKKFNVSYSKVNLETNSETNERVHIAQLGDVPGYAHVIEETAPVEQSKGDKPHSLVENGYASGGAADGMVKANNCEKAVSGASATGSGKPSAKEGISIQKSDRNRSFSNDLFFDTFDNGLRKEPFGDQTPISVSSNLKRFGVSPEDVAGVYSPPDFDWNVDANSVAAASAAALKEAIEKAQLKINFARELMERRKEGLQGHENYKENMRAEGKRARKMAKKAKRCSEKEFQENCEADTPAQLNVRARGANNVKLGSVNNGPADKENLSSSKAFSGGVFQQTNKEISADMRLGNVGEEVENSCNAVETKQNVSAPVDQQKEGNGLDDMVPSSDERSVETLPKIDFAKAAEGGYSLRTIEGALDQEKIDEKLLGVREAQDGDKQEVRVQSAQGLEYPEESETRGEVSLEHKGGVQSAQGLNYPEKSDIKGELKLEQEDNLWKLMKFFNPWQYQDKPKELDKPAFEKRVEAQELEENNFQSLGEECDLEGNAIKQIEEAYKGELTDARNDKCDGEMSNCKLKEMSGQEEDEALQDSCERLAVEGEPEDTCNPKENDDEHENFGMESDSEERLETLHQQERLKKRPNDTVEFKDDIGLEEQKEVGDIHEIAWANMNEEIDEDPKQMYADAKQQEIFNCIETDKIEEIIGMGLEEEVEGHESQNDDDNAICTCDSEACEEFSGTQEGDEPKELIENVDVLMDEKENEGNRKMVEMNSSVREEKEDCSLGASADDSNLAKGCKIETSDITCFVLKTNEINQEIATATLEFRENYGNMSNAGTSSGEEQNEQGTPESDMIPNLEVPEQGLSPELNYYGNDLNEAELSMNWKEEAEFSKSEEVNSDLGSSDIGGSFDDEMTVQPEQINGSIRPKGNTQEADQSIETSQSTEKIEENHYTTLTMEERISEDCQQKKTGLDKERLKKLDEAKERERAREKEKLAVERAMREARERAYAEARERAAVVKANPGAQQRVIEQVREKTGKASAKTNSKFTEKSSIEARLKAERAAVERATAEARERALEKALAEKLSGVDKVRKLGQSPSHDPRHRGSCPSSDSRHPTSSETNGEKPEGTNSESAQRRKARLERYQRTAERAAKALAEKNKRDLLAQREQAERSRLAESLDADIKRWLSGKQGNLRALLSTLQYILGPDSGWQPVSLTEIVTTAAVKKAYRKATLCVHPDKLQQRGASLQQKYICEKVFDLLKEAWNKFRNAEER